MLFCRTDATKMLILRIFQSIARSYSFDIGLRIIHELCEIDAINFFV